MEAAQTITNNESVEKETGGLIRRVADELAIRNLAARFSDIANTRDTKKFCSLWTSDGVWDIGYPLHARAEGADNIGAMIEKLLSDWEFFVQMTHSGVVRIEGDEATARWMIQETARKKGAAGFYNNFAFYEDRLRRVRGEWLFAERRYEYIYLDDSELSGKSFTPGYKLEI